MKTAFLPRERLGQWAILTAIAFGGSAFFGASLAAAIPGWDLAKGALWLTVSAGTGWLLLGPTLIWITRLPIVPLIQACLVAMAIGEGVLACGAIPNWIGHGNGFDPVWQNSLVVAISNVAMAASLALQLRRFGVPVGKTLLAWFLVLDGGGALAFWIFYRVIFA